MPGKEAQANQKEGLAAAIAASPGEPESKDLTQEEKEFEAALQASQTEPPLDPRTAHHLSLYHYPQRGDQIKGYFIVKIPGGGNCGFYAIALGLINQIVQSKLALTPAKYTEFWNLLKGSQKARQDIDARLKFFETGENLKTLKPPRLKECVPHIQSILNEIDAGRLDSLEQLRVYLTQNMESQADKDYFLESMVIVLGSALRGISCLVYENLKAAHTSTSKNIKSTEASSLLDTSHIELQPDEGVNAPEEQLNLISGFFGFEFRAFHQTPKKISFKSFVASEAVVEVTHELVAQLTSDKMQADRKATYTECAELKEPKEQSIQVVFDPGAQHWDLLLPRRELLRPPYLFSPFPSLMIQQQPDPETLSFAQYESRRVEADKGKAVFDRDSYLLIAIAEEKPDRQWRLVYVNDNGEHEDRDIRVVEGLSDAIAALPRKAPGDIEVREKKEVIKAIATYARRTAGGLDSKDVFDAKELPAELTRIIDQSKVNQAQLWPYMRLIGNFSIAIGEIQDQQEIAKANNLVKLLMSTAGALVDESMTDSDRIRQYILIRDEINQYVLNTPERYPDIDNTLINILLGIVTIGIFHCINRCVWGQWTLFHDFNPSFTMLKSDFQTISGSLRQKLEQNPSLAVTLQ